MTTQLETDIRTALTSADYRYARTRYFMGEGTTYLYGVDHVGNMLGCGSGVICMARGPSEIVDPLIREIRNNSPLSPTEGLRSSR